MKYGRTKLQRTVRRYLDTLAGANIPDERVLVGAGGDENVTSVALRHVDGEHVACMAVEILDHLESKRSSFLHSRNF